LVVYFEWNHAKAINVTSLNLKSEGRRSTENLGPIQLEKEEQKC